MKIIKRLSAIAVAIAMLAVMGGVPASAAAPQTTGSLTLNDNSGGKYQYSAYRVATFDVDTLKDQSGADKTVFTGIKMDTANDTIYRPVIVGALGLSGNPLDSVIFDAVSKLNADATEALAIKLRDASGATATAQSQNGKFDSLPIGYYLIIETGKSVVDGTTISKPILVSVPDPSKSPADYNVKIDVKNSKAGIEKKIVEHDSSGTILVETSTAAIGDIVKYQSLADIPAYPKDKEALTYYVTDTFCSALDFNPKSMVAEIINNHDPAKIQTEKTLDAGDSTFDQNYIDSKTKEKGFRLTLTNSDEIRSWGNAGYKLRITYNATLNSDAKTGKTGNPNSVNLTYSIKPNDASAIYTTPNDTVITYTYRLVVTKKDHCTPLSGATFELQDSKGIKIGSDPDPVTGTDGTVTFTKLEQGDYQLVETAAPSGYNKLDGPIKFTVGATNDGDGSTIPNEKYTFSAKDNADARNRISATWNSKVTSGNCTMTDGNVQLNVSVQDTPGFILPGTGGIGTTIFTVSGIVILLVGGLLAFLYYRKKKDSRQQ